MRKGDFVVGLIGGASIALIALSQAPAVAGGYYGIVTLQQVNDLISSAVADKPSTAAVNTAIGSAVASVPTNAAMSTAIGAAQTAMSQSIASVAATIPAPASSTPPSETVGGAVGSTNTFRRGDAIQPRITRSNTIVLDATGAGTFDWTPQGALATPVQPVISPIYSGASAPTCTATSVTATSVSVKCLFGNPVFLTVGQLTTAGATGMSLNPFVSPAAGISVAIVALPKS